MGGPWEACRGLAGMLRIPFTIQKLRRCRRALAPEHMSRFADPSPPQPPTAPRRSGAAGQPVALKSETLFGTAPEVLIDHRGVVYRLRQTALGKLILTK